MSAVVVIRLVICSCCTSTNVNTAIRKHLYAITAILMKLFNHQLLALQLAPEIPLHIVLMCEVRGLSAIVVCFEGKACIPRD